MKKRFSWLLLYLFILSSCSDKYYKSAKNPHTVSYRGQRTIVETKRPTHAELNQRTKALIEANMNQKDFTEDDFHEVPPAMQITTAVTQKYIEYYKDIAVIEVQRYNIPASITSAQGILESGSGQGRLARYDNDHFGIKCHATWNGKTITHDDNEESECFRRYKYAYESFEDRSQFLMKRRRYSSLFELNPTDYESWARGLKRAGYATDPAYAKKLITLIKRFSLHQYGEQVVAMKGESVNFSVGTDIVSTPLPEREVPQVIQNEPMAPTKPVVVTKKEVAKTVEQRLVTKPVTRSAPVIANISKKVAGEVETPKPAAPAKTQVSSQVKKEAIAEVYYQVRTRDTLYRIAHERQVPVQQLMKLNSFDNLASSNLKVGQQIRVN